MLSAAPGSNIHLAWCIPELETLMWFVGESRWQVHGSALLTDRAGASGVVHNNSQRLSPPFFLFRRSIYITPLIPIFNTHRHEQFFFSLSPWYQCLYRKIAPGSIRHADIQLSTICLTISCSGVPPVFSLSLFFLLCLHAHLYCLISLHSLLLPQHSCTCPLTGPPSFFGFYLLHQSLLLLYLF